MEFVFFFPVFVWVSSRCSHFLWKHACLDHFCPQVCKSEWCLYVVASSACILCFSPLCAGDQLQQTLKHHWVQSRWWMDHFWPHRGSVRRCRFNPGISSPSKTCLTRLCLCFVREILGHPICNMCLSTSCQQKETEHLSEVFSWLQMPEASGEKEITSN